MVEGLHVWRVKPRAALAIDRCQDHCGGISTYVIIVALGILKKLEHCLGRFGILNRKYLVHGVHVQKRLYNFALLPPLLAVLEEKEVYFIRTDQFIGNVCCLATGVDGTPLVEEPRTILAIIANHTVGWIYSRSYVFITVEDHDVLRTQFQTDDRSILDSQLMESIPLSLREL